MRLGFLPLLLLSSAALLTGCAVTADSPMVDATSSSMQGRVFGGQQPVTGSTVTVWQMGNGGYGTGATSLATTTTDGSGNFGFASNAYTCGYSNAPVYVTAQGGNPGSGANANLMLAAGVGTCGSAHTQVVNLNEVSTAVTAFALGQFFNTTLGGAPTTDYFAGTAAGSGTYNVGLVAASSQTIPMLLNLTTGRVNPSSSALSIESTKIYSIANTLAACVNSTGQTSITETTTVCGQLFNATLPPGGSTRPADTLQAAVQMSRYPFQNVSTLFNLGTPSAPFVGLSTAPNDWTVGVSYTSSSLGLGINGVGSLQTSSNIDIDASGKVWFPSNSSGAHGVAYLDPASGSFNGPYSTGLSHPQYVVIDLNGNIWATDLASASVVSNSTTSPTTLGTSYTASGGATGGPLIVDTDNTLLFAYTTTGSVNNVGKIVSGTVGIDHTNAFGGIPTGLTLQVATFGGGHYLAAATYSSSFGCADEFSQSGNGQALQFSSGGSCASGGIVAPEQNVLLSATTPSKLGTNSDGTFFTAPVPINAPEGIAVDGAGSLWIANSGNGSVSVLGFNQQNYDHTDYQQISPVAYRHDSSHGNTMTTPYGVAIDRSGNVWVSNASCLTTASACAPSGFTLTELIGAGAPTITPLSAQGASLVGTMPSAIVRAPGEPRSVAPVRGAR